MSASDYIDRDVGQFPVSIGSSMALESLLHMHPNQPQQPSGYKSIRALWVNLRTLIRNLYSAMPAENTRKIKFEMAALVLLDEIRVIPEVFRQHGQPLEVVFYFSDMDELKWQFPKALYKKAKTERQIHYETYERMVLLHLWQLMRDQAMAPRILKKKLEPISFVAAMLTHYPHELLHRSSFERLFLLESHTGKLKAYNTWYTKLNGLKEENQMPFNEYTVQVFGEGVIFDSQPKGIRAELKELASYKRWTGITSNEKMRFDIYTLGSRELKANYAELVR